MKYIQLTQGKHAIVDDGDFEFLNQWNWIYTHYGYASRNKKGIYMHRVIMNAPKGVEVDHRNGNKLDNQRCNLRLATKAQQQMNAVKRKRNKVTSSFKGLTRYRVTGGYKWSVTIKINKQNVYVASFDTEHHAALAYDLWAHDVYGEFAKPNFQKVA